MAKDQYSITTPEIIIDSTVRPDFKKSAYLLDISIKVLEIDLEKNIP